MYATALFFLVVFRPSFKILYSLRPALLNHGSSIVCLLSQVLWQKRYGLGFIFAVPSRKLATFWKLSDSLIRYLSTRVALGTVRGHC